MLGSKKSNKMILLTCRLVCIYFWSSCIVNSSLDCVTYTFWNYANGFNFSKTNQLFCQFGSINSGKHVYHTSILYNLFRTIKKGFLAKYYLRPNKQLFFALVHFLLLHFLIQRYVIFHNVLEINPRTLLPTIVLVIILVRSLMQRHRVFYKVLEMNPVNLLM